jgi:hypothetical protein
LFILGAVWSILIFLLLIPVWKLRLAVQFNVVVLKQCLPVANWGVYFMFYTFLLSNESQAANKLAAYVDFALSRAHCKTRASVLPLMLDFSAVAGMRRKTIPTNEFLFFGTRCK